MNKEFKGLWNLQKYQDLAACFAAHESFLNTLLREEHTSLTELASFLAPDGLLTIWINLTPKQRQGFFTWALRKHQRVAEIQLVPSGSKVSVTLATPFLQRVLAVEIIRTFSRSRSQGPTKAISELRDGIKLKRSFWVDHRFV
jgi:hypothetical protein